MSSMSQYYFKCFMSYCSSSTFYVCSLFTLLAFSLSYLWLPFFIVFFLIFLISTYFFIAYSSFSTTIYSLYFSTLFFEVHSLDTNSHASYMQFSTFFLLLSILSQKFHQSTVCSSSISFFYTDFSMPRFGYMAHTQAFSWGFW